MASQQEVLKRMDEAATNAEHATEAYNEVLTSDGEKDIQLVDGSTTPNLNKRLSGLAKAVASVNGRTGNVVITPKDIGYPELDMMDRRQKEARFVVDKSGLTQQDINNGVDSVDDLINIPNPQNGSKVYVKSYHKGLGKGGGFRLYESSRATENDGFLCIYGWVLQIEGGTPTPYHAGAKGNKGFDDTIAIQKCAAAFNYVDLRNGRWKTTGKINLKSGNVVDLQGGNISANNANDPVFEFEVAGDGLSILHGGGVITGTADSFLKCSGTTNNPTSIGQYARQIRLEGLLVSSETIDKFLDFDKAVRQIFMHKVHAYTRNGINANGKCVEFKAHGCIIYGSTGELGTYGLKLRSPGGGAAYNEGFHFTDCTNDNFGKTYDVTDIYVMSVTGGHSGCVSGGKVATFGQPISTSCRDIKFTGVNIAGPVEFSPVGGRAYHAQFTGCVSEICKGANISIGSGAAFINIYNHDFHTSTSGVAVVCSNGSRNINVSGISCDTTFIGGVQLVGTNGDNCSIRDINYNGTGNVIYLERPALLSGIPMSNAGILGYFQVFNTNSIQGTFQVGSNISTVSSWFAKGETGIIICELSFSGADVATQRLDIVLPSGISIAGGSGWSSGFIIPSATSGRLSVAIPYSVTDNIQSGAISIKNSVGNPINVGFHGYFGFKRA